MSRYTAAYSGFIKRLREVEILLRLARQVTHAPPLPAEAVRINALCRSAVVLLSSHIEGFVEDLGEVAIDQIARRNLPKTTMAPKFRYYFSRDLLDVVRKTSDPATMVAKLDEMLIRDGHIWDASSNFRAPLSAIAFTGNFSNPTHDKIRSFFGRFGYNTYHRDLAHRLAANFPACTNMIDQVIDQRNKIAHGDTVTTGTPTDLEQMIQLVKQYCREADCVVANWFRSQGCPLR